MILALAQNTNMEDGKREPLVWKKCIVFNIKSTPTSTPLLRSLIMNNIFLCTSNRTCSKPTAFCATTQPEAESHAYCVYNNNISLQKGPDAILMHCFCLYCEKLFLVVVPLSSVSKPNKRELPKKQGCFVYNHFIDKSRNVDTLGPVELIVWPGQGNQGDWREQDDQGEVSIIIFGMMSHQDFKKIAYARYFRHFVCVFVFALSLSFSLSLSLYLCPLMLFE